MKTKWFATFILTIFMILEISTTTFAKDEIAKIQSVNSFQISASNLGTAAVKPDGSLWMWGDNSLGLFGDCTTNDSYSPIQVPGMDNVAQVCLNENNTMVLKKDGTIWIWGVNSYGQLGNGSEGIQTDSIVPLQVPGMNNVVQIGVGSQFAGALKSDGSLWLWGAGYNGHLGNGHLFPAQTTPVHVMDGVAQFSMRDETVAVIKTDGSLWTWGSNLNGEIGNGKSLHDYPSSAENGPFEKFPVPIMDNVVQVETGGHKTAAIKNDGSLWIWGENFYGAVGNNTTSDCSPNPAQVMDNVAQVSVNGGFTGAIKNDGTVWMWGVNSSGQLGNGSTSNSSVPVQVPGMSDVSQISVGQWHTVVLKNDGTIWTWGNNSNGQLGDGTLNNSSTPKQVFKLFETPEQGVNGSVYRLYNSSNEEHLFTSDFNEVNTLSRNGWNYEGVAWIAPDVSEIPVFRLYSPVTGEHLYTTDSNEVNTLSQQGWSVDNNGQALFYSGGPTTIYRLYNETLKRHHLTKDENEYNNLGANGWNMEGPALNALS